MVDEGFGNMGYGFGLPLGSVHQEELTIRIYSLREGGFTDQLDEKWSVQGGVGWGGVGLGGGCSGLREIWIRNYLEFWSCLGFF